jgi:hypothetical protein
MHCPRLWTKQKFQRFRFDLKVEHKRWRNRKSYTYYTMHTNHAHLGSRHHVALFEHISVVGQLDGRAAHWPDVAHGELGEDPSLELVPCLCYLHHWRTYWSKAPRCPEGRFFDRKWYLLVEGSNDERVFIEWKPLGESQVELLHVTIGFNILNHIRAFVNWDRL